MREGRWGRGDEEGRWGRERLALVVKVSAFLTFLRNERNLEIEMKLKTELNLISYPNNNYVL